LRRRRPSSRLWGSPGGGYRAGDRRPAEDERFDRTDQQRPAVTSDAFVDFCAERLESCAPVRRWFVANL
jgi:hypothetical protein